MDSKGAESGLSSYVSSMEARSTVAEVKEDMGCGREREYRYVYGRCSWICRYTEAFNEVYGVPVTTEDGKLRW